MPSHPIATFRGSAIALFALSCGLLPATVLGQAAASPAPAGTVSGTITYGDTQRPARFAKVTLTPVHQAEPDFSSLEKKDVEKDPNAAMKALTSMMHSVTMMQGQTGLDGSYAIAGVAPGDYYLSPSAPGYVSPLANGKPGAKGKPMTGVTVVHVEANRTSRGDAALERGAALSGTATFDDGTPAAGLVLTVDEVAKPGAKAAADDDMSGFGQGMAAMMSGGLLLAVTDDRGHFRLAGMPAGEYTLEAKLSVGAGVAIRAGVIDVNAAAAASPLTFFAPGTLHKAEATKFNVRAGEERADLEIRLNLGSMHSVSGHIASAVDHHPVNSGTVTLTDAADKDFKRTGHVDSNGAYTVAYVPPGTYQLKISDAADTEPGKPGSGMMRFAAPHTLRSFDEGSQSVVVTEHDVAGVNLELKQSEKTKKDLDLNGLLGGAAAKD